MVDKNKIFLTGFMGSGKTTLGKKLALIQRRRFVDLDAYIENKNAKSIPKIFEELGETEFRKLETASLDEVLLIKEKLVVSLGGGTICFNNNLQKIRDNGLLVYLKLPNKVLADRLKKSKTIRPIIQNLNDQELLATIEEKMEFRRPFYEQSHIMLNEINLTAQILQHNIIEYQEENNF